MNVIPCDWFNLCIGISTLFCAALIYNVIKYDLISVLICSKIDPNSKEHGGNLVAQVLKSHNVTHLFTLIGGHISPLIVASENLGIRVIDTRQEVTAVFAADALARISGTIGVAAVTAGPGVTNTITAVKNAQMAETPLLLLGGAAATLLKGRGALQDIDQMSLLKSICKYTKTVTCVRHLVPVLQKAIQIAYSGTPGPVFVELPLDILYPYQLVKQEMKIKENPKGILQSVTTMYLKAFLHYQFASGFIERNTSPLPVHFPLASNHQVQKCQDFLSRSKRPLFLLGSQALIPPTSAERLKQALEALNIPCFLGGMSRGLLGWKSPLHIRQKRREALQEADLVILAGSVCDFRLSYGRVISPKSKVIAVNMDKKQLYKNSGIFWNPTIALQANVPDFIIRLSESISQNQFESDWLTRLQERDNATEKSYREKIKNSESDFLDPVHLLYELESALPENTVLVADGGDFVSTAAYIVRPRGALKWLDPGAFGTLGVGAGFAIGAKLCYPDCNVVILYGDGSLGYSLIEFDTFIRHKIPVVAVVGNDACWTQIAREQVPRFGSDVACNLTYNDYHKIVQALGGKGIYLSGKDKDDLVSKFKHAIELSSSGSSVLVNAAIGKTDFRSGSISI